MLSKFFLRAAVTAAALTCTTGSASAEQFQIMMMEQSFFPNVSYVKPGDTVTFVNMSGITRDIQARNGIWSIAGITDGAEATITVQEGWKNDYLSRIQGTGSGTISGSSTNQALVTDTNAQDLTDEAGIDEEAGTIVGVFSFGEPPRDAVVN